MPKILYQHLSDEEILQPVREYYQRHREMPSFRDWRDGMYKPSTKVLLNRFGKWSNVIRYARRYSWHRVEPFVPNIPENQVYPDRKRKGAYELPVSIGITTNDGIAIN